MTVEETRVNSIKIAMEFIDALVNKDNDRKAELFHEEGTYWVPGQKELFAFAGSYSKQEMINILTKSVTVNTGEPEVEIHGITADGNRVAVDMTSRVPNAMGGVYNQDYHMLFVIKEDKIFLWKEFMDTGLCARNFAGIQPD